MRNIYLTLTWNQARKLYDYLYLLCDDWKLWKPSSEERLQLSLILNKLNVAMTDGKY